MARAVEFPGANRVFAAPPGRSDVGDLHTFVNGHAIVSAWELTPEEMEEVARTGRVFLSSLSGDVLYPVFLGSESEVRRLVADYGSVWKREGRWARVGCFNPLCSSAGTEFPTIHFAPADHPDDEPLPYRLEVPQATCMTCRDAFDPKAFFSAPSREAIVEMITTNGLAAPVFGHLEVEWVSIEDAVFKELVGGGQARLWFA